MDLTEEFATHRGHLRAVAHRMLGSAADADDALQEAALADSVGLALLVVLDTLTPAERLAFVLHDLFALPFAEIAPILDRPVAATKMLASRARRRVRTAAVPSPDLARQHKAVDAFLAASRNGDFEALVALLDPDVVARAGAGAGGPVEVRGADGVGRQALAFAHRAATAQVELIDGAYAIVAAGLLLRFQLAESGRIVMIDIAPTEQR